MIPDISVVTVERTEEAQRLFDRAADGETVELAALSALELCVLGGPKHVLCEDVVARAWTDLGRRRREKAKKSITEGMVKRGLLTESREARSTPVDDTYNLAPDLALAMAARCRPTFIVVTEVANRAIRTPRLYAIGDQEESVRGIVVEEPAVVPAEAGDLPHLKKLGPLGRLYRYDLVSQMKAADLLARWAMSPVPSPAGTDQWCPRMTSLYRRSEKPSSVGARVIAEGDGETAKLFLPADDGEARAVGEVDLAGMRQNMTELLGQGLL